MEPEKNTKQYNSHFLFIVLGVIFFAILNESVYIFTHRDVLSNYLLKEAKYAISKDKYRLGLYLLTKGASSYVDNPIFWSEVKNYFTKLPYNYNLSRVDYDLAIIASKSNYSDMVPVLLKTSIKQDPDFSFWRVELANYYLSVGQKTDAEKTLEDCIVLSAPRKHCLNYQTTDFNNNHIYPLGFLLDSIDTFYK